MKAWEDLKDTANKVAAPAAPIINVVLISGVTAGALAGAAYVWSRLKKRTK